MIPILSFLLLSALVVAVSVSVRYTRLLVSKRCKARRSSRSRAGTPRRYPHLDPLFGLDLVREIWQDLRGGQLSEGMRRRHVLYGPTFSAVNLGKPCIYTTEPENIRAVTTDEFGNFKKSAWASEAAKYIGNGVLLNEGESWKQSRTCLKPIFARTAVDEPALLEPHVRNLIGHMETLGAEQGDFEFGRLADMFMLDVVTEFLFGKSTGCLESPRQEAGHEGVKFLTLVRGFDGPSAKFIAVGFPAWLELLPSYPQLMGMVSGMRAFFRRRLAEIMASTKDTTAPRSPWSVFRSMRDARVSEEQIQGELQNVFFAGWDTTSSLLSNTIYVLLRHQDVQERLRDEVSSLCMAPPTKRDLDEMVYLRSVVMEVLRLYSPVTSHSRTASVDTILPRGGGPEGRDSIFVRAGTTVVWSTYSLNRDPRWYGQDWAEFRPERWATSSVSPRETGRLAATADEGGTSAAGGIGERKAGDSEASRGYFMPFGSGPRACLGRQMAKTEVSYVVVRLLQEFPCLRMKDGAKHTPFREAEAVSFYDADGVWVRGK